jgi:peptidoglycan L-alanyl-D-glutamate endopeptidase CwlK
MPNFSIASLKILKTCHDDLQRLFLEVIKTHDCTVLCGYRNEEDQNKAFKTGKSKLEYPKSAHNKNPSHAIDIVPYPIDWNNTKAFYHFAGFVRGIACQMGIQITWGGDWDSDFDLNDQSFNDLPHFELK